MNRLGATVEAEDLGGTVGDYFVGIHVSRSRAAGLEDIYREFGVQVTVRHLRCRLNDRVTNARFEIAEVHVCPRTRTFDETQRLDEAAGKDESADREILNGARRLRTVIGVRWYAHFP